MNQPTTVRAPRPDIPKVDPFEVQRRIRRSGLSYAAQALLCAVLDYDRFGQSSRGCTASLERLAADTGMSSRNVARLLLVLIKAKWIKAESQVGRERPLRMGETCTNNHGQTGRAAECTYDKPAHAPMTTPVLHVGQPGRLEELGGREKKETSATALPPDRGSVASGEEDPPRLEDGTPIPGGISVVGGRTLLELAGVRAVPDEELRRLGHLRHKPAG